MSEWSFIIAAYAVTWLVLGCYVSYLLRRRALAQRRLSEGREVED
ncbi:MAG: CcmD family protein [Longimicrobiales bacterium]